MQDRVPSFAGLLKASGKAGILEFLLEAEVKVGLFHGGRG
jgi:hypothetical protein